MRTIRTVGPGGKHVALEIAAGILEEDFPGGNV